LRSGLRIAGIVLAALAALVLVLTMTPVGFRLLIRETQKAVRSASGLELAIGSLHGNLFTHVALEDVTLTVPGGPRILAVDKIAARYSLGSLFSKEIVVPELRVDGATLLLDVAPDGTLVGWSRFAAPAETTVVGRPSGRAPWPIRAVISIENMNVAVRDTARGFSADVAGLEATAHGGPSEFQADLACSLTLAPERLREPVRGRLSTTFVREGGRIGIGAFALATDLGRLEATGEVRLAPAAAGDAASREGGAAAYPVLDLAVTSNVDVGRAARVAGLADLSGRVAIDARATGRADSLLVRGELSGDKLAYAGVAVENLRATVEGSSRLVEVTGLEASALGGRVLASGTVAPASTSFRANVDIAGLDLSRLGPFLPKGGPRLEGRLAVHASVAGSGSDTSALAGTFGGGIEGLAVGSTATGDRSTAAGDRSSAAGDRSTSVGDVTFAGRVSGGAATVEGQVLGASFSARASLAGEPDVLLDVGVSDLSIAARAFGAPELAGSGTVTARLGGPHGPSGFAADAEFPELRYRGIAAGPVSVTASGDLDAPTARFRAFGGALAGDMALDASRRYRGGMTVDGFDLAVLLPDSLRQRMSFAGRVSAALSVAGEMGGRYLLAGTVSALAVSARGEDASLELPFQFRAVPDTVRLSWASLRGSVGSISVAGEVSLPGSVDLTARLDAVDLGRLARFAPEELPEVAGTADGMVRLTGSSASPRFGADVDLRGLSVRGIEVGSVALDATSDSTDVVFDIVVESAASGTMSASGTIPVAPDSVHLLSLDPTREFGGSFSFSKFAVDASELLPGVRGEKRFSIDGEGLLTGRADSLGSMHGRGTFDDISAAFDLMSFSLSEPFSFEVAGGDLSFDRLALHAVGRRVLGAAGGGTIIASGSVTHQGDANMTVAVADLDVGRMARAFAPAAAPVVEGRLDLNATLSGKIDAPTVNLVWDVASPSVGGVGFDRLGGEATLEPGVLRVANAALVARGQTVTVAGTVPLTSPHDRRGGELSGAPPLDLTIAAQHFRLDRIASLPPGVKSLKGELNVDLRITGSLDAPAIEGTAAVARGSFQGFGLSRPIENIAIETEAAGSALVLKRLEAGLGSGKVGGTGFIQLGKPADVTFWVKTKLDSPEVSIPGMFDARAHGALTWVGSPAKSQLAGKVTIEKLEVTYPFGLADILTRRPTHVVVKKPGARRSEVALDLDVAIEDKVSVTNDLTTVDLRGGVHVGGTAASPSFSGGVYAESGTVRYLGNEFKLQSFDMSFTDPRRRDPHVDVVATADVEDRAGELYLITLALHGYLFDVVPELTSTPDLSSPDIVALLTFGDRMGSLFVGGGEPGSSRDTFADLARKAFLGSLFGVAENTLERLLRLDRIAVDEAAVMQNGLTGADVTIGKRFGGRVSVNYTTAVGRFDEREVEVSLQVTKLLSLESRADPEGNHAVELKVHVPFK
jgi:autotransporter translocation and assembly factor TamB